MKRLLLMVPMLMSTMAIGPCAPIDIGGLDGGAGGSGGSAGGAASGGRGSGGRMGTGGRGSGGRGGAAGAAGSGGAIDGGVGGGTGGSGGLPDGGAPDGGGLHPTCEAAGWVSESVFYADQINEFVLPQVEVAVDLTGTLHLAVRFNSALSNSILYTRRVTGGDFEFPPTYAHQGAAERPKIAVEPSGVPHVTWGGTGGGNIYYTQMNADGTWSFSTNETPVMGSLSSPLSLQVFNGSPFLLYWGPIDQNAGAFTSKKNGVWTPGSSVVPLLSNGKAAFDNAGTAHLLYNTASGLGHAVVQSNGTIVTDVVSSTVVTAIQLAMDGMGRPHAVYARDGGVRYAVRTGTTWAEQAIPQGVSPLSLMVDGAGNDHVIMTVASGLAHALRSGGSWTVTPIGMAPGGVNVAIEDGNGTVHAIGAATMAGSKTHHYTHDRFCVSGDVVDAPPMVAANQGFWLGRTSVVKPDIRAAGAMAYDSVRQQVVLYGGQELGKQTFPPAYPPPGTWTLSSGGSGWVQKAGATQPGQRAQPGMTFDSARGRVVLMGDSTDTAVWEWDGTTWSSRASATPMPAIGTSVRLAYDSTRAKVMVWASDGIWEWDPTKAVFTSRAPAPPAYVINPAFTREAALAFDAASGRLLGFGGGNTWEWDPSSNAFTNVGVTVPTGTITQTTAGTFALYDGQGMLHWRRGTAAWVRPPTLGIGPMRRQNPAMVYDPVRRSVVVFGGTDANIYDQERVYSEPAASNPFRRPDSNATNEWALPMQGP